VPVPPAPEADKFKVELLHSVEFVKLTTLKASTGSLIVIGMSKKQPFESFTLMVYDPANNEPKVPTA
jgi:hypothetical protein